MISALKKLPDKTLELTITIPWSDVKVNYEKVMEEVVKNAEIQGFRKGKAPRKLVEEKTDKNKIYSLALEEILPKFYSQAVQEQKINPIINPKIKIISMEEGKDWQFSAQTCEKPEIVLADYRKEIQGELVKEKIWLPGKKIDDKETKNPEENKQAKFNKIIEIILKTSKITLPLILIEDEIQRLLSQTLDEIKKLGLTLDQYLASTGKTIDSLKNENRLKAEASLKLEFILEAIADQEKVVINQEEIESIITKNPDKAVQENLRKNSYLLTQVMRRQKTLDLLNSLN